MSRCENAYDAVSGYYNPVMANGKRIKRGNSYLPLVTTTVCVLARYIYCDSFEFFFFYGYFTLMRFECVQYWYFGITRRFRAYIKAGVWCCFKILSYRVDHDEERYISYVNNDCESWKRGMIWINIYNATTISDGLLCTD